MSSSRDLRRRITSSIMTSLCVLSVLIALVPVVLIFFFVVQQGIGSLDWNFFTKTPVPPVTNPVVRPMSGESHGCAFAGTASWRARSVKAA